MGHDDEYGEHGEACSSEKDDVSVEHKASIFRMESGLNINPHGNIKELAHI
jgi:hypothetical protein